MITAPRSLKQPARALPLTGQGFGATDKPVDRAFKLDPLEKKVNMASATQIPDVVTADACVSCGACCIEAGPIPVRPDDATPRTRTCSVRDTVGFASWEADFGVRQMQRHLGGRCKALKGEVGISCSCAVYDRRPRVCAAFAPNSEGCREARERMKHKLAHPEYGYRGYGRDWRKTV